VGEGERVGIGELFEGQRKEIESNHRRRDENPIIPHCRSSQNCVLRLSSSCSVGRAMISILVTISRIQVLAVLVSECLGHGVSLFQVAFKFDSSNVQHKGN
jgi:hypothetical protein